MQATLFPTEVDERVQATPVGGLVSAPVEVSAAVAESATPEIAQSDVPAVNAAESDAHSDGEAAVGSDEAGGGDADDAIDETEGEPPVETAVAAGNGTTSMRRPPLFDPGWLLLIPGIVLISITLILPAQADRDRARFYRDRAQRVEQHGQERLKNHHEYLGAVEQGDPATLRSLVSVQLNQAPAGTEILVPSGEIAQTSTSMLNRLEPKPLVLNEYDHRPSTLERWALDGRTRLWLLAMGAVMVFAGLLPATRSRAG